MSFDPSKITWEAEAAKVFSGSEGQQAEASAIRSFHAELEMMEAHIAAGIPPSKVFASARHWLAVCLASCNMENFKNEPTTWKILD